jgi:cathepsin D
VRLNIGSLPFRILGLAFPAISNLAQDPFFHTAVKQNSNLVPQFSFYLAKTGSELYLGGTNKALFTGAIEYHALSFPSGFWQIGGGSAFVGSTSAVSGFDAIIDSGTTIMYGPPTDVAKVYAKIPGSQLIDPTNGFYSYPCASNPSVSFSWGGRQWTISNGKCVTTTYLPTSCSHRRNLASISVL